MKQKGFTLIEVMISLFIGGLVLGGVMFTFISMKVTTKDTMMIGELQESGRLAINIMQRDIEQVGFWATYYEDSFTAANTSTLKNPANDCFEGLNNGSFPDLTSTSNFRSIYAKTAGSSTELNCLNGVVKGTDILQVKFLQGKQVFADTGNNETQKNDNYFIAEQEQSEFLRGVIPSDSVSLNATIWPYSHHVYYIAEQTYQLNNNNLTVPVLMRKRLVGDNMVAEAVMEGVENMRFTFGLDTTNDNRVDTYKSLDDMTPSHWENRKGVLTVQIFLLIRSLQPDAGIKIKNQKYILGDDGNKRELSFNDSFRRTVFTTTIRLSNAGSNSWGI